MQMLAATFLTSS